MCGKTGKLVIAKVEGTELKVCEACVKFGTVLRNADSNRHIRLKRKPVPKPESKEMVVSDAAEIIRKKREQMGLKQIEFAKMINEKESLVQNIESGKFTPSITLSKKLEKQLKVTLIEEYEEAKPQKHSSKGAGLTLGDVIKIKGK